MLRPTVVAVLLLAATPPAAPTQPPAAADPLPPGAVARIGTTQFRQVSWHKQAFFTADGKTLIVTDDSSKVRWWDPVTGRLLHELEVPNARFADADFVPGSGLLAVIGSQFPPERPAIEKIKQTVWLIDTGERKVVHTLRMPEIQHAVQHKVRFTPDGKRVVSAVDGELRVWDAKVGDELIRQKVRNGADALAVSPDGKVVAFGRYEVSLWRWETADEPKKLAAIGNAGTELMAFAPDGTLYIQPLSGGGPLQKWDIAAGRQVGTFDVGGYPRCLSFSPDGKAVAVGYASLVRPVPDQYTVTLWDVATGARRGRFSLGQAVAQDVSWSPDGARLAVGTDARLWTWDVRTSEPLTETRPGHEGTITALAFGPDGTLFTGSDDHTIRSWGPTTGRPGLELVHNHWVRGLAVSPDGALVAGSALRNDLRIWEAKTGRQRFKLLGNGEMGGRRAVGFTADGARLVAWGDDEYLRVWDMRNGKLLSETRPNGGAGDPDDPIVRMKLEGLSASAISADGSVLALGSRDGVRLIDTMTGKERAKIEVPGGAERMAISPDGKRLAVAGRVKPIEVKMPDGSIRESAAREHSATVFDLADRKPVWEARADGWLPAEIAFTPDGTRVASTAYGENPSLRFWDAATGMDAGQIDFPRDATRSAGHFAFDRTGKRLAVALGDTTALVYDLEAAVKPAPPR